MPAGVPLHLAAALRSLRADAVTVETHRALAAEGVDVLLLKGPSLAQWLFAGDEPRFYGDSDLLVSERQRPAAEAVLGRLGFERDRVLQPTARVGVEFHAEPWHRRRDSASIDLHRTLMGAAGPPDQVFEALFERSVEIDVFGERVHVLDVPSRAMYVAMHAAQHGAGERQPVRDLERALEQEDLATWRAAAEVAVVVGARPALAAGLQMLPAGRAVLAELELGEEVAAVDRLRAEGRRGVHTLLRAEQSPGARSKLPLVLRETFVAPRDLAAREGIDSRGELAAAYARRLARAVPTLVRYWRLRRTR